jgi:hypothetical protein
MVIRALDYVPHCYTAADGDVIHSLIHKGFSDGEDVQLSFDGVFDVPSSFVNSAIVALLNQYDAEFIKSHLTIVDATHQIGDMVRRCLANGLRRKENSR